MDHSSLAIYFSENNLPHLTAWALSNTPMRRLICAVDRHNEKEALVIFEELHKSDKIPLKVLEKAAEYQMYTFLNKVFNSGMFQGVDEFVSASLDKNNYSTSNVYIKKNAYTD